MIISNSVLPVTGLSSKKKSFFFITEDHFDACKHCSMILARSQTKDHGHWSGSETSAHVKSRLTSAAYAYTAGTVSSRSSGLCCAHHLGTAFSCLHIATRSFSKAIIG